MCVLVQVLSARLREEQLRKKEAIDAARRERERRDREDEKRKEEERRKRKVREMEERKEQERRVSENEHVDYPFATVQHACFIQHVCVLVTSQAKIMREKQEKDDRHTQLFGFLADGSRALIDSRIHNALMFYNKAFDHIANYGLTVSE